MSRRTGAPNGVDYEPKDSPEHKSKEKQVEILAADSGHFSMIKALHLADLITELNGNICPFTQTTNDVADLLATGFCGVMSILSSMRYCLGNPYDYGNLWASLLFMPFGLFFDFMDGKVARWRKKASLMGQELDSLADLVRIPATRLLSQSLT